MPIEIPLSRGMVATIDECDAERVMAHKWCVQSRPSSGKFYAKRKVRGERRYEYLHRFILEAPADMEVDHRDRNGLNNVRSNLRLAARVQNSQNQSKVQRKDGSIPASRYKGVWWHNQMGCWNSVIRLPKERRIGLGTYTSEMDAAAAWNVAASILQGEFACLNDVPPATDEIRAGVERRVNRRGITPSSEYRGVKFIPRYKVNRYAVFVGGVRIGAFATEVSAAAAYNLVARAFYGDKARLNSVPDDVPIVRLPNGKPWKGLPIEAPVHPQFVPPFVAPPGEGESI